MDFVFEIKRLRKLLGMSQVELAKKVGMTQKSISDIERGEVSPNLRSLVLIFDALDADVNVSVRLKYSPVERLSQEVDNYVSILSGSAFLENHMLSKSAQERTRRLIEQRLLDL